MRLITNKALIIVYAACAMFSVSAKPTVGNVTAKQRFPWNGKVDISYTLTGDMSSYNNPFLSVTANDIENGTNYVADASALSGDTGTEEGVHHVVWDMNAQGLEFKSDDVVFSVAYEETPPLYCVIDLSAGVDAESYPVSHLADVPSGGWTDEYKTDKLVLRRIEPGSIPTRDARITKPYYIGVFEVTQAQWALVTGGNPSYYKGDMRPVEHVSWNMIRGDSSTYNWPNRTDVDSNSFVGRIQARTGLNFDLPTEAQWEYACRAGTTSAYNNGGDSEDDLKTLGRYSSNKSDGKGGYSQHTTVGSYLPNGWGLYDMHGNLWEWCLDWYAGSISGDDPIGPSSGSYRVLRGGGWDSYALYCTASHRNCSSPSNGNNRHGFRLVRTLSNGSFVGTICTGESSSVAIDLFEEPEAPSGISLGDPYCYVDWTKSGDDGALWCREHWDWTDCWADAEDWAVVPINGAADYDELIPVIVYGSADESMLSEVCIEDEATFKARFKSNIEYDIGHTHTDPDYIKSFVASRKWLIAKISYKAEKITPKTFFMGLKGGSEYRKFVIVWNHSDGAIEDGYDDTSETAVLPLPVGSATVSNNGLGARTITVTSNAGYVVTGWSDNETNTATVRELQPSKSPYYVMLEAESVKIRTITFDANGGECGETSREVAEGEAIGELPTPTREGCEFLGWYVGDDLIDADYVVSVDITAVAQWKVVESEIALSDGLVAYWPFNGNANDASGNGNDGVVHGATLTMDRFGRENGAYRFDGNDWIEVKSSSSLSSVTSTMSLMTWVKVDSLSGWIPFLCKGNRARQFGLELGISGNGETRIFVNDFNSTGNGSQVEVVIPSGSITVGEWCHVAISYTGEKLVSYINGVQIASIDVCDSFVPNDDSLYIGKDPPDATEYYRGELDDIRIYNRALSAAEVKALYDSTEEPIVPGEPSGITLGDPFCWATNNSGWCNLDNEPDCVDCWADGEDSAVVPIIGATDSDELVPVIVYGSADASMVSDVHIEDEATFKARISAFPRLDWSDLDATERTSPEDIKSFDASRKWLVVKINRNTAQFSPKTFFVGLQDGTEYRKFIVVWEDSDGAEEDGYSDDSEAIVLPLPVGSATVSNNGSGARTVTVAPSGGYVVAGWSDDETNTATVRELQPSKSPYYVMLEAESDEPEDIHYEYVQNSEFGGIVLTGFSGSIPENLTLPSEIDGQTVVGIGEYFMEECDDVVSLTFPDTIRFIGNGAFGWSANIAAINLNEGLERIGYDVFDGLISLEELVIPSTVVSIDLDSFNYSGLGGGGIRSISIRGGDNAYFSAEGGMLYDKVNRRVITACATIETAAIPSDCAVIGSEAFGGCGKLVSVAFPESLEYIGGYAFDGCTSLMEVDLSDTGVTEIANGAFMSCAALTEVRMPATLARVGAYLFGGAKSLSKVVYLGNAPLVDIDFGWSGEDIEDNAPYFPNGDMYVDYDGEYDPLDWEWRTLDRRLAGVVSYVEKGTEGWGTVPGTWQGRHVEYLPSYETVTYAVSFDANGGECGEVSREVVEGEPVGELPTPTREGYEFLGWYIGDDLIDADYVVSVDITAVAQWKQLPVVTIPVFTIEDGVLTAVELNGATEIVVPDGVTQIGSQAFMGCAELTSVVIPEGVTSIGESAFEGCVSLEDVSIPSTVTRFGRNSFAGCPAYEQALYRMVFGVGSSNGAANEISLTVTNVVVHYVVQSVASEAVTPSEDIGIVNVIAEVSAGKPVAMSSEWANQYPGFEAKFGKDFTAAITKPTGKRDGAGNSMLVWQDFVAGTDPTDEDDVFTASISFDKVTGDPVISWTPELTEAEAAKRVYKKYGKVRLNDAEWSPIDGDEASYNFFKVSVEMK